MSSSDLPNVMCLSSLLSDKGLIMIKYFLSIAILSSCLLLQAMDNDTSEDSDLEEVELKLPYSKDYLERAITGDNFSEFTSLAKAIPPEDFKTWSSDLMQWSHARMRDNDTTNCVNLHRTSFATGGVSALGAGVSTTLYWTQSSMGIGPSYIPLYAAAGFCIGFFVCGGAAVIAKKVSNARESKVRAQGIIKKYILRRTQSGSAGDRDETIVGDENV